MAIIGHRLLAPRERRWGRGGLSVYRLPSGVTKEPGREDNQGSVEDCEKWYVSTADILEGEVGGGGEQRTKEGEN